MGEYLTRELSADENQAVSQVLMDVGPADRYAALLFTEKEGFNDLWQAVKLQERFDLAIASTKGMTNVAFRELVDELTGQNADLRIFVLTDFDITGVKIAHWISASNHRYTFDNEVEVERIGITYEQALALRERGRAEPIDFGRSNPAKVEDGLRAVGCADGEIDFLVEDQLRVELNALSSGELVQMVETALADLPRVIPDNGDLLLEAWREAQVRSHLQVHEAKIRATIGTIPIPDEDDLHAMIERAMADDPTLSWDAAINASVSGEGQGE